MIDFDPDRPLTMDTCAIIIEAQVAEMRQACEFLHKEGDVSLAKLTRLYVSLGILANLAEEMTDETRGLGWVSD